MPLYQFICTACGRFESSFAMADVPDATACGCGADARRAASSPALCRGGTRSRLIEATATTAETPAVVDVLPPSARRTRSAAPDPRHAKLPRP